MKIIYIYILSRKPPSTVHADSIHKVGDTSRGQWPVMNMPPNMSKSVVSHIPLALLRAEYQ